MKLNKIISLLFVSASLLLSPLLSHAWELDKDNSSVSFVSIKKNIIGEVHQLKDIAGTISDNKTATITIRPDSVETLVPIRNERVREFLFETSIYPTIEISADVETLLKTTNQPKHAQVPASLTLHGITKAITLNVYINETAQGSLIVSSYKPVIINATEFGLDKGILKLASLVNNIEIANSVPVSFLLTFTKSAQQ